MKNKCILSSVNSPYKYGIIPCGYVSSFVQATDCAFSAGFCIEFCGNKAVFVDGRYKVEANRKLSNLGFDVLNLSYKDISDWVLNNVPQNENIYFSPHEFSPVEIENFEKIISRKLLAIDINSNPTRSTCELFFVEGYKFSSNFERIQYIFEQYKIDYYLLCDCLSIAWLLNIRAYNGAINTPVLLCRAIINKNAEVTLYAENDISNPELLCSQLSNVEIKNITALENDLNNIKNIATDFSEIPYYIQQKAKFKNIKNPCLVEKCIKTDEQIKNIKYTNILDSVAVVKFMNWVYAQEEISEYSASQKIDWLRSKLPNYICKSFENIIAIDENSAEIHHHTDYLEDMIRPFNVLLFDTGGQYKKGTTDVTRTICKNPSKKFKYYYTLVLKGHINLFLCEFDKNTRSSELDKIARLPLVNIGADYPHGTGHGIGYVSHVHEPYVGLSSIDMEIPLQKNMVFSNEPGYYESGEFGIRIENSMAVIDAENSKLKFEPLTLVPYDINLIDMEMLSQIEKNWLTTYHKQVYSNLSEFLSPEENMFLEKLCSLEYN